MSPIHHQSLTPLSEGILLEGESLSSPQNTQTFIELKVYFVHKSQPLDPVLDKESVQAWGQLSLHNSFYDVLAHLPRCSTYWKLLSISKGHLLYLHPDNTHCCGDKVPTLHAINPSHNPNPLLELCDPQMHKSHVPGWQWWHLILSMQSLQFFPLHIKMCIDSYILSRKHQVTVRFTGHTPVWNLFHTTFLTPKIWRWLPDL